MSDRGMYLMFPASGRWISSGQAAGLDVVQDATILSSTCLFSAGKPFPFQVHNIFTYPCQPGDVGPSFYFDIFRYSIGKHLRTPQEPEGSRV